MPISQNSFMAFAVLIGFIVYVTTKGELPAYMAVFTGAGGAGVGVGSQAGSSIIGVGDLTGGGMGGGSSGGSGWMDLPGIGSSGGGATGAGDSIGAPEDLPFLGGVETEIPAIEGF